MQICPGTARFRYRYRPFNNQTNTQVATFRLRPYSGQTRSSFCDRFLIVRNLAKRVCTASDIWRSASAGFALQTMRLQERPVNRPEKAALRTGRKTKLPDVISSVKILRKYSFANQALRVDLPKAKSHICFETLRCDFKNSTILGVPAVSGLQHSRALTQRMRDGPGRQRTRRGN